MRPFWKQFVRNAVIVGVSLAVVGYVLGRAFLIAHRINSGGLYVPENERVLWQTPVVMAAFGIGLTSVLSLLGAMVRRPVPVAVTAPIPPGQGPA
jgi:hypothetical protein